MKAIRKHKKGAEGHEKQGEAVDLKGQLARALADYDNLRKRVERERETVEILVKLKFIARLLPILDMLETAQEHSEDKGLTIIANEFNDLLKEEGVEKIEAKKGDNFDEEVHEAIEMVNPPAGAKSNLAGEKGKDGKIVEVVLSGWKLVDGPIIRPVKVKVSKK